jgi:hypothetical protein
MSAIEVKLRTSTNTHKLEEMSQWHVSNWNQAQNINWHSQAGWDFTVACQQLKSSSEHQLALTPWMGFHSGMSAIEIKLRTSTGTHKLDGISQWHVSNWNQAQNINWHSLPGWDFTVACQQLKSSSEHQLALTYWMGFHKWHVSNWNQAQNINWHSLPGWDFTVACQQLKSSSEHQLALTPWMGFHSGMSAIEIKLRTSTGTHWLDGISQWHVSNWNQAQNINWHSQAWMGFHSGMSAIEIKVRTSTGTHSLDGISQWHVSNWNQAQNINWHSHPGWDFTVACQQLKSSSEHQLALTFWMGFHSGMSAIEIKLRTSTGTH